MDPLGALWAFATAAACISAVFAAAEASRRLHRMVRRGAALRRQFKGPPPSSLLLGGARTQQISTATTHQRFQGGTVLPTSSDFTAWLRCMCAAASLWPNW